MCNSWLVIICKPDRNELRVIKPVNFIYKNFAVSFKGKYIILITYNDIIIIILIIYNIYHNNIIIYFNIIITIIKNW